MPKFSVLSGFIFSSFLLTSCAGWQYANKPINTATLYEQSIADAAVASPAKILPLLPLPVSAQVTVVSWVTQNGVPCEGTSDCVTSNNRVWVTLDGEVQNQCRQWHLRGDMLRGRLEQLLGLPMNSPAKYRKTQFVVMQIPRERLERACLGVNESDNQHPQCTLDLQTNTSADLQQYVLQQMASSYVTNSPKGPGYPFTRLGYTYDWSPEAVTKKHYGASEFLIMPKSQIKVLSLTATDDYCN